MAQWELAERAGLGEMTILKMEQQGLGRCLAINVEKVAQIFETEGVMFTTTGVVDLRG